MPDEGAAAATADSKPPETPEADAPKPEEPAKGAEGDAPLGEAGEKALAAFKERAKEAEKRAKEAEARAQEYEERDKSELEKAQGKVTKLEQAKAEAEAKLLRYEVARDKFSDVEVQAEAVDLLKGTTREELEASADKILSLVKSRNGNDKPDFDGGAREPAGEPDPEKAHGALILEAAGLTPRNQ